ncbi:hypothetical protein HK099_000532 [Clydaea vesicula]|uniref:Uncharacterized protein n=1 Tax=Clydaea vesicula TaxID=447962 RepID=A0AAD5TV98_9FUNG|nr:hypothetical protein HK099_000532 [Clydaea vesicula]
MQTMRTRLQVHGLAGEPAVITCSALLDGAALQYWRITSNSLSHDTNENEMKEFEPNKSCREFSRGDLMEGMVSNLKSGCKYLLSKPANMEETQRAAETTDEILFYNRRSSTRHTISERSAGRRFEPRQVDHIQHEKPDGKGYKGYKQICEKKKVRCFNARSSDRLPEIVKFDNSIESTENRKLLTMVKQPQDTLPLVEIIVNGKVLLKLGSVRNKTSWVMQSANGTSEEIRFKTDLKVFNEVETFYSANLRKDQILLGHPKSIRLTSTGSISCVTERGNNQKVYPRKN